MTASSKAWLFIAVTLAFTWACQTPGILVLRANEPVPAIVLMMMVLGSAGPSLVALWFRVLERGALRLRAPASPAWSRPIWLLWLVALAFSPAAHLLGSAVLAALGLYDAQHLVYPPLLPEQVAIAVVAPLGEEFGWRGYALPRLQSRWSPVAASLLIGVAWALWHIPTLFVPAARGTSALELGLYLLSYLAGSVVYTWLFNAGNGSVVGPIVAHLGIHLDNVFRASTLGDGVAPLLVTALAMTGFAALLILTGQLRRETAVVTSFGIAWDGGTQELPRARRRQPQPSPTR
jgi:membrane protease YdiL (CAAX protease family)